jgi:hypothetical protein
MKPSFACGRFYPAIRARISLGGAPRWLHRHSESHHIFLNFLMLLKLIAIFAFSSPSIWNVAHASVPGRPSGYSSETISGLGGDPLLSLIIFPSVPFFSQMPSFHSPYLISKSDSWRNLWPTFKHKHLLSHSRLQQTLDIVASD